LAPCRIGVEACGTAHYWARELIALGHEVRLMPAPSTPAPRAHAPRPASRRRPESSPPTAS
jgi:transposase